MVRLILLFLLAGILQGQATVVLMLRHGEKLGRRDAAPLSERGHQWARGLPAWLGPHQPAALYASDLVRTQQTLGPLAQALGQTLRIYRRGDERALATAILRDHLGQTVVVCGHSDRLGDLAEGLGWVGGFEEVKGYGEVWQVRIPLQGGLVSLAPLPPRGVPQVACGIPREGAVHPRP